HHSNQDKPLSDGAFNHCLERAGWLDKHSAHGFRSSFSTIMNDRPQQQPGDENAVEAQLAHGKKDKVASIYNRGTYFSRRAELCAEYASLVLAGAPDAQALLFGAKQASAAPNALLMAAE